MRLHDPTLHKQPLGLMLALLVATGCGRSVLGFRDVEVSPCWPTCAATCAENGDCDPAGGDANTSFVDWPDYVQALALPPCAPGLTLMVNTSDSTIDGGSGITSVAEAGATLSLLEALWIAHNVGGQHTILFDPAVFPLAATPHILFDATLSNWPEPIAETCIDGRGANVVIEVINPRDPFASCTENCGNVVLNHSEIIGLTWLSPLETRNLFGWDMWIEAQSQVAGCRLATDGLVNTSPATTGSFQLTDATLGPGNAIGGGLWAVYARGAFTLVGNHLGYDPVTKVLLEVDTAAHIQGSGVVADNIFIANNLQCYVTGSFDTTFRHNWFGRDPTGAIFGPRSTGIGSSSVVVTAGSGVIGPDNILTGLVAAIDIEGPVHVTRNVISDNTYGIRSGGNSPVAPEVTTAGATEVSGTCPSAGTIEVFSDPGNQGAVFLGTTHCDGVNAWTLNVVAPSGRNVTATFTDETLATSSFSTPVAVP